MCWRDTNKAGVLESLAVTEEDIISPVRLNVIFDHREYLFCRSANATLFDFASNDTIDDQYHND